MKKLFLILAVVFLTCSYMSAQKKVEGVIKDSYGSPIAGANVSVKGTQLTTSTDIDGKFAIQVHDDNAILIITYIGLSSKEVAVGSRTYVAIELGDPPIVVEEAMVRFDEGIIEPDKNYATVRVMFATDRKRTESNEPKQMFGTLRSENLISYGTCDVSIPRGHLPGELEEASVFQFEFREDPEKHIVLLNVGIDSKTSFFDKLKARLSNSSKKKAFIFIHGYNVSFEDAARRTAQMSYDLAFDGVPVFYSWPSVVNTAEYNVDQGNSQWSQGNLKTFLEDFLQNSGAENIYLIAHSMGNRALTGALSSIISENPTVTKRIKEIILAAPDIDAGIFTRDIAPALTKCNKPITLYASSKDLALVAAKAISDYPRAGQAGRFIMLFPGIETIDASNVSTDLLGHSYFSQSPGVLADIYQIIREEKRANKRERLHQAKKDGKVYWKLEELK